MKFFKHFFACILCTVVVLMSTSAHAGQVKLSWKVPTTPPGFEKYRVHWGEKSGKYTQHQDVKKSETSVTISNLMNKETYYFAATTVTASGQESEYSNEVSAYLDVDTDQDGLLDQEEMNVYGTNPNLADTDGDGINDGDEVAFWKDAWNQDADGNGQINLLDRDADGDGVADGIELNDKTNPADSSSFLRDTPRDLALLPIMSVQARDAQEPNVPANTVDGDMGTRWSAQGDGQWISYDLGTLATVNEVAIAWLQGAKRKAAFAIEVSIDGEAWNEVFSGDSSGTTDDFESYPFSAVSARYIRIVGYGNTSNAWNSITEVELYGRVNTVSQLPVASVQARDAQKPNVPANTVDGDMGTRWSAQGDGQWISYDLGTLATVNEVAIAWLQGAKRKAAFAIEVSIDGEAWDEVFSGDSSGTTDDFESYPFSAVSARYIRIVGYGNTSNAWNSITDVKLYGFLN